MFDFEEVFAVFWLWLAFTGVVGFFVFRIAALLIHQRRVETAYRLHLAMQMGAAAREQQAEASEPR